MIGSEAHINSDSKVTKKVKPIEYAPQPIVSTDERFVSENEVARITGLSVQTLRNNRFKHRGIPYHKVGRRVLYKIKDVYKYLEGHRIKPVG
ncbi:MAG: helix-turn-helix domain-containing protein [Deltaproteobacteria bacterium]|nr:helix-turn-helix domain-containing protein [Deltaproteobacteria bacterium]